MTLSDVISKRTVFGKDAFLTGNITANTAIVNDNSSFPALKITQTGSGPALLVEDQTSPDATPFVIQADGKVLVGTDSPFPTSTSKLQLIGFARFRRAESISTGSGIVCDKARGTIDSQEIVQNGDQTGFIDCWGFDGTNYINHARIETCVDGTPSSANMPGRISFLTTQTTGLTEKMRISANGNVGIGTTNPNETLHVDGSLRLDVTTETTVGSAGSATPPPAQPTGWMVININGTNRKIPFYNI